MPGATETDFFECVEMLEIKIGQGKKGRRGYQRQLRTSLRFSFESFQNRQSEFHAIASMVWLAVYLRQRWSRESKPVASHGETGR